MNIEVYKVCGRSSVVGNVEIRPAFWATLSGKITLIWNGEVLSSVVRQFLENECSDRSCLQNFVLPESG